MSLYKEDNQFRYYNSDAIMKEYHAASRHLVVVASVTQQWTDICTTNSDSTL